jgi:hypothetical protein
MLRQRSSVQTLQQLLRVQQQIVLLLRDQQQV